MANSRFTIVNDDKDQPILISRSLKEQIEKKQQEKQRQQQQQQQPSSQIDKSSSKFNTEQQILPSSASLSGDYPSIYPELPTPASSFVSPSMGQKESLPNLDSTIKQKEFPMFPASTSASSSANQPNLGSSHLLIEVRSEYERKLQHYQKLWQKSIEDMDRLNKELLNKNKEIFNQEVKRIDATVLTKHFDQSKAESIPGKIPCKEMEEGIIDCFKKNGKRSLLCADLVRNFSKCIDQARLELLKQK